MDDQGRTGEIGHGLASADPPPFSTRKHGADDCFRMHRRDPVMNTHIAPSLTDRFGRTITYMRVSVTDRCDLRCLYCMSEAPDFLPKAEMLSFDELDRLCALFVRHGVRRLRITGGEPLMRRGLIDFLGRLTRHVETGALDEISLTTNGTRLAEFAASLARLGVTRINVSLDTLDRDVFKRLTRRDRLAHVLEGVEAARDAGLIVKINTVALKRDNAHDIPDLVAWAHARNMDIALIETMPLGETGEDRTDQYVSLADIRRDLDSIWSLEDTDAPGFGPARYVKVRETGRRIGFITPMSHNFCASCNRVRLTCAGRLYLCLGQDDSVDFRPLLRAGAADGALDALLRQGVTQKPEAHAFEIGPQARPAVARFMSATGG